MDLIVLIYGAVSTWMMARQKRLPPSRWVWRAIGFIILGYVLGSIVASSVILMRNPELMSLMQDAEMPLEDKMKAFSGATTVWNQVFTLFCGFGGLLLVRRRLSKTPPGDAPTKNPEY